MATARRSGCQPGKSDPIDALAVAQATLREPGLPAARLDGPTRQVKLLCDHRADLVVERTNRRTYPCGGAVGGHAGDLLAGRPVGDPDQRAAAARRVIAPVRVPWRAAASPPVEFP
jgi:hypothetical protein